LRLLAGLAQAGTRDARDVTAADTDTWRQRITQVVAEVQGLIESSKFEPHDLDLDVLEKKTADAQIVFVLLLTLARHRRDPDLSEVMRGRALEIDGAVAKTLEALAARVSQGPRMRTPELEVALAALQRSLAKLPGASADAATTDDPSGPVGLYRSLVTTLTRLSPEPLATAQAS
jgi:hypothetical protein